MAFASQGGHGVLCAGYAVAAELGRWSLETDATLGDLRRCTVHARIVHADPCLITMGRFTALRLTMAPGVTWSWPITAVAIDDGTVTIAIAGRPVIARSI